MKVKYSLLSVAMSLLITPAFADAVFTLGNNPQQPSEQNILYTMNQTGPTIFGWTNQDKTKVQFSSSTDTLQVTANGQAKVTSMDGLINNLTISVPGQTFGDLIFNPFKLTNPNDLSISVSLSNGTTNSFGYGDTNGNNFLTITTSNNDTIKSVTIASVGGFQDLQQPRISSLTTTSGGGGGGGTGGGGSTPEPSTIFMLGSGLIGAATMLRRKLLV